MSKDNIEIKKGSSYYIFFNEDNINNKIIHIRAIVDNDYVVSNTYSMEKKRWIYSIDHMSFFQNLIANNNITRR